MVGPLPVMAAVGAAVWVADQLLKDKIMYQCANEIRKFHDEKVTLPKKEQDDMRGRRDANRKRLKSGLAKNENPNPVGQWSQGSYAMRTMIQEPGSKYDIDDGVYFDREALRGSGGAEKTALAARQMVRDALDSGSFATPPKIKKNCVRVFYEAGYHVDIPVYRMWNEDTWIGGTETKIELASTDWKVSDPRKVTDWFKGTNEDRSPGEDRDQFRRIVRLMKKFSHSRDTWPDKSPSGLTISKLMDEEFVPHAGDDERSLHQTMVAMKKRLDWDLAVPHPVVDEWLADGDDPKTKFLCEKLSENLKHLDVLSNENCKKSDALMAWRKVFNDGFFEDIADDEDEEANAEAANLSKAIGFEDDVSLVAAIKAHGAGMLSVIGTKVGYMKAPPWPMHGDIPVRVSATLHSSENGPAIKAVESGDPVGKGLHLRFDAYAGVGALPDNWRIYWRVTNTGREAAAKKQRRGKFHSSKSRIRWEATAFTGVHWVEAFVVDQNMQCRGKSLPFHVVVD